MNNAAESAPEDQQMRRGAGVNVIRYGVTVVMGYPK